MAQDFHKAFGLDGAANDTTINTVDIDGVNMVAIQALEARTAKLKEENRELKDKLLALEERLMRLESGRQRNAKRNKKAELAERALASAQISDDKGLKK
jgi:predicted RNase H-like nuclease (RuvC/YqgF family)